MVYSLVTGKKRMEASLLACMMLRLAGALVAPGAPLKMVEEMVCDPECVIDFEAVKVETSISDFMTRGYNGAVPGPTIRIRAGDLTKVRLRNKLSNKDNYVPLGELPPPYDASNPPHPPNTTSLHVHGLHVAPRGIQDDVFAVITPGEERLFQYEIPSDHMGGIHLWHAHPHGATNIQAGTGAMAVIIVEDEPGSLPPEVAEMEEIVLSFFNFPLNELPKFQDLWNTDLLQMNPPLPTDADGNEIESWAFLTNGQIEPTFTMNAGQWYRFRMVNFSPKSSLMLHFQQGGNCEMELLAKDGVYIHEMPRKVNWSLLFPASRSEVAVRCHTPGDFKFGSSALQLGYPEELAMILLGQAVTITAPLMRLHVVDPGKPADAPLRPFATARPCYLQDFREIETEKDPLKVYFRTFHGEVIRRYYVNGYTWGHDSTVENAPPIATYPKGSVVEVDFIGGLHHAIHLHATPFQLQNYMYDQPELQHYFAIGDWHDTVHERPAEYWDWPVYSDIDSPAANRFNLNNNATARWYNAFPGAVPVHCHINLHSDLGMMGFFQVVPEGSPHDETLIDSFACPSFTPGFVYLDTAELGLVARLYELSTPTFLLLGVAAMAVAAVAAVHLPRSRSITEANLPKYGAVDSEKA